MNKPQAVQEIAQGLGNSRFAMGAVAQASMVNRTHRVVRERARVLADARNRRRSLWIPVVLCTALAVVLCTALWKLFDSWEEVTDTITTGVPDDSKQIFILLLWSVPLTCMLLMVFRRRGLVSNDGSDD